jgi:flagellar protein FlbD
MISLTRLNGATVAINPDLITWIDLTPDTTVSLFGGEKIIVRESLDEIVERIVAFRRLVGPMTVSPQFPPSAEALLASVRRTNRNSERPSVRPAPSSIRPVSPHIINRK